ncbi:glyoxalase [Ilumatobacter nonamiensis]|uniref:glyoxalase n=1 Tax=Ilumatobacter nonamiensis TaxID=467093 RepID=UPI001F4CECCE|nr:glyoxalase [Ilumatobacter nonamiensis]
MTKSDTIHEPTSEHPRAARPDDLVPEWVGIDHVQVAIPVGAEDRARRFYVGVLGLVEVPKPAVMAARGGAWFERGAVRVHVGAEDPFVPARKAHPALALVGLRAFIDRAGLDATWNDELPDVVRCHVFDPFGNRIELIEASGSGGGST